MSKTSSGKLGEEIARGFLIKQGFKILDINFKTKFGEIDLICLDQQVLVFVEVKARWSRGFGLPEEAVTRRKITTIAKVGQFYRQNHPRLPLEERIDVVAIELSDKMKPKRIELIRNASG